MEAGSCVLALAPCLTTRNRAYKRMGVSECGHGPRQLIISIIVLDSRGHRSGKSSTDLEIWLADTPFKAGRPPLVLHRRSTNLCLTPRTRPAGAPVTPVDVNDPRLLRASSPSSCPVIVENVVGQCEIKGSGSNNSPNSPSQSRDQV